jgi:hypothetical protein
MKFKDLFPSLKSDLVNYLRKAVPFKPISVYSDDITITVTCSNTRLSKLEKARVEAAISKYLSGDWKGMNDDIGEVAVRRIALREMSQVLKTELMHRIEKKEHPAAVKLIREDFNNIDLEIRTGMAGTNGAVIGGLANYLIKLIMDYGNDERDEVKETPPNEILDKIKTVLRNTQTTLLYELPPNDIATADVIESLVKTLPEGARVKSITTEACGNRVRIIYEERGSFYRNEEVMV